MIDKFSYRTPLFKDLSIMKFKELVDLRIATLMYKAYSHNLPNNIQCKFVFNGGKNNYTKK